MDPKPVSIQENGTLYKRAIQLPDGSWAPMGECCCGPGQGQCEGPNQPMCVRVELEGIQGNPWRLGQDDCLDDCGYWYLNGPLRYSHDEVTVFSGVNGVHIVRTGYLSPIYTAPCNVVLRRIRNADAANGCVEYGFVFHHTNMTIRVFFYCDFQTGTLYYQGMDVANIVGNRPGPFYFVHNESPGTPIQIGETITVENQLTCTGTIIGDERTSGPVGIGGTASITVVEFLDYLNPQGCEPETISTVYAYTCDGIERITVDLETITPDAYTAELAGELYIPSNEPSDEPPIDVVWVNRFCEPDQAQNMYARLCDNPSIKITYDPALAGASDVTCVYKTQRFYLTLEPSTEPAVSVLFSELLCDEPAGDPRIAVECDNPTEQITYDRDAVPPFARGCRYQGKLYELTPATSDDEPVAVQWTSFACSDFGDDCSDIIGPNDPRCNEPQYQFCPQCRDLDDGGGPDPRPSNAQNAPDEDNPLPLGDIVKRAIRLVSGDTFEGCSKCEKRRLILNRFGAKVGRAVIARLEKSGML